MVDCCECGNEPQSSIKCEECSLFLSGRAKDLSAPMYIYTPVFGLRIAPKKPKRAAESC